jgi:streptogramin lyase
LWFTEFGNAIGSLDPTTTPPTIKSYSQSSGLPAGSGPQSITVAPGGTTLWFTELSGAAIGALNTSSANPVISNFGTLQGMPANARPYGITTGPDGSGGLAVWFTDPSNNALGKLTINSAGTVTIAEIPVPSSLVGFPTFNSVITGGPGGKLYFTEALFGSGSTITASGIGIYDPSTNTFSQVTLPSGSNQEPFGLTVGRDQNIWFSEGVPAAGGSFQSSALGLILNPSTSPTLSEPSSLSVSGSSQPYRISTGPDGNVWFTLPSAGKIGMVTVQANPATDTITTFAVPTTVVTSPDPTGIVPGPDGNVWFTDTNGAVGRALLDRDLAIGTEPPATATAGFPFAVVGVVLYTDSVAGVPDLTYNGNVTATLNGGGTLGGTTTVAAASGVARFTNLIVNSPGTNFSLLLTPSGGPLAAPTTAFSVVNPHLVLDPTVEPPSTMAPGTPFAVRVLVATSDGQLDNLYNGNMTLSLNPGGSTLSGVSFTGGVAYFSNLSVNNPGLGYTLTASTAGLAPVTTAPFNVSISQPPPQSPIVSPVTVLTHQNKNRKGKSVGPKVLLGYEFAYSLPMSGSAGIPSNYLVQTNVKVRVRVGRRTVTQIQQRNIPFTVQFDGNETVSLLLVGRQTFTLGGRITFIAAGLTSTQNGVLNNGANRVFNIAPKGFSISG